MSNCNNNCEAVAGLNESAAKIIQYEKQINNWLNGSQNATVNIGGVNTPTLLGLAMSIKQLVGVWPDGITIKICADKKIYVPLKENGGVHVGDDGLYIDSSDFIQLGGGLSKDPATGAIFVDFDQMPTNKFDAILETFRKGLKLPKWLTANKNFYVDKNHASASDVVDEGRGESASKPFQSIQQCVNYVADNYNLARFNANINIAPAVYEEYLSIGNFQSSGGALKLLSTSSTEKYTIRNIMPSSNIVTNLHDAKIEYAGNSRPGSSGYQAISAGSYINLYDVEIDTKTGTTHNKRMLLATNGGEIVLRQGTILKGQCHSAIETYSGGIVYIFSPVSVSNVITSVAFAFANGGGSISVNKIGADEPVFTGSATGSRYRITGYGLISTGGRGPDYFPGNTAGTIVTGSQYS